MVVLEAVRSPWTLQTQICASFSLSFRLVQFWVLIWGYWSLSRLPFWFASPDLILRLVALQTEARMAGSKRGRGEFFPYNSRAIGPSTSYVRTTQATPQAVPALNTSIQAHYQALANSQRRGQPTTSERPSDAAPPQQTTIAHNESTIVDRLMAAISPALTTNQNSTTAQIERLSLNVESLTSELRDVRKETRERAKEVAASLEKAHTIQIGTSRTFISRLDKLEKLIGTSYDRDDNKSLLDRMDTVFFAVEELLERAKDPDASHDSMTRPFYSTPSSSLMLCYL